MSALPVIPEIPANHFGPLAQDRDCFLTRIRRKKGELIYADDQAATLRQTGRTLEWTDQSGKRQKTNWWDLSVRAPAGAGIKADHWLALAMSPYGREQIDFAPFRRGSQKADDPRRELPVSGFADEKELFAWLEERSIDKWEKDKFLVAGVPRPTPVQLGGNFQEYKNARFLFGLCEEPCDDLAKELLESKTARDLIRRLENDDLDFWHRKSPGVEKAYDAVKEEAHSILFLAARQCLAGPDKEVEKWRGKPVTSWLEAIFRNLVNHYNRREKAVRGKESQLDESQN